MRFLFIKSQLRDAMIASIIMTLAAVTGWAMKPTRLLAEQLGKIDLEHTIPTQFGEWTLEQSGGGVVVNPQQEETINRIYAENLSRSYLNKEGQRVMLSIAYGRDQSDDGNALHYPEVCYPSQGFQVLSVKKAAVQIAQTSIRVKRLETELGERRYEPVTYWTTVGTENVLTGVEKKLVEMHYSMKGLIPDGLIFRVSTIDRDSAQAYRVQDNFVRMLMASLQPGVRDRISGVAVK